MGFDDEALHEGDAALIEHLARALGRALGRARARRHGAPLPPSRACSSPTASRRRAARVEIASPSAEADGHPRLPEPSADAAPPDGQLRLLSPASPWLMNSTFGNDRKLRHRIGAATVTLHPREAAARGLRTGDAVTLRNATGSLQHGGRDQRRRAARRRLRPKCRWPSHETAGANVNALNPGAKTDMGESSAVHGVLVELVPRHEPALAEATI